MTLRDKFVEAVEAENEMLRERIAALEALLGLTVEVPLELQLTAQESKLVGFMLKRDLISKSSAMMLLYGSRPDGEEAEPKILDVFVCHIRRKLKPFGLSIETRWGEGYYFTAENKQKLRAMLPGVEAAA